MKYSMIHRILRWRPHVVFLLAALLIAAIAITDWKIVFEATLGFLYMFPLVLLGTICAWWQLAIFAAFCTFLSEWLDSFPVDMQVPRNILIFTTLLTAGLLSRAMTKAYRREVESLAQAAREMLARRSAEEQLEFLIQSSAAAVLTMTADGEILLANPAAHRLFGLPEGALAGRRITRYVPALGSVPSITETDKIYRTQMQTRGQRENGEVFLADVFFSTYNTPSGPRLAALLVDGSEILREREEASLQQLLAGSRILVAAVSHEVRNICGAIGVMHENLARQGVLRQNQDFDALGSLVETLAKIASVELKQSTHSIESGAATVDLHDVLTDLRIVLEPTCEESGIALRWELPEELPLVQADRHSLLQVLLNLTKNSQRALESVSEKLISVSVSVQKDGVRVRVSDNGPGIPPGHKLFQPLQKGADATGLGLYLSRAFVRSFRGDLRHDAAHPGASFVIDLASAADPLEEKAKLDAIPYESHSTVAS
jgi:two-component system, LuxR family, sensor kinase FixL